MEIDPLYSDWLTVVDDDEFNLMSKLDYWERLDDSSLRRLEGDKFYVVVKKSEWSRYEEICKRVEMECAALDAWIGGKTTAPTAEGGSKPETKAEVEHRRLRLNRFGGFGRSATTRFKIGDVG